MLSESPGVITFAVPLTFNESKWEELGYLTGDQSVINGHERLLRSFRFGDDDYGSCVFEVVEDLIALDTANQPIIIDFIGLQEWMQRNFPRDYEQLYGHTHPLLSATEELAIASLFELPHMQQAATNTMDDMFGELETR